jgi:hypothetical protein
MLVEENMRVSSWSTCEDEEDDDDEDDEYDDDEEDDDDDDDDGLGGVREHVCTCP